MTTTINDAASLVIQYGRSSFDYYKLWDKQYLSLGNNAFAAYGQAYGVMVVLENPVGPGDGLDRQIDATIQEARLRHKPLAFLAVGQDLISYYDKKGFVIIKIGQTVRIDIKQFVATTIKHKNLHYKQNRGRREGYHLEVLDPPHSDARYQELVEVSDIWLSKRGRHEQGFANGYFEPGYIRSTRIYTLLDRDEKIIAYTTQTPSYMPDEVIIDVVRYLPGLANGAIEYLVTLVIMSASKEGYRLLNMGMTPMAGLEDNPSNLYERLMALYYRRMSWPFNVRGLHTFKAQFEPELEDRYLVCQKGPLYLLRIAFAILRLVSVGDSKPRES